MMRQRTVQFKNEPQVWESPRRTRHRPEPEQPESVSSSLPETSNFSLYPPQHRQDTKMSLVRVQEIQKYAKVLPHCSAPVRLNHLSRCKPLKGPSQGHQVESESFESLFYHLSALAVSHQNKQRPLPSNNFPKIPRPRHKSKNKRKRSSSTHSHSNVYPTFVTSTASTTNSNKSTTAETYSDNANKPIQEDPTKFAKPQVHELIGSSQSSCTFYSQQHMQTNPRIIVSQPQPQYVKLPIKQKNETASNLLKNTDSAKLDLNSILNDKCDGNIENLMIADIKFVNPIFFIEMLDLLKQKVIQLEMEIEKTVKIENPTEARKHVQDLESSLIKVMPLMNLLTSLVRFNLMYEEYQRKNLTVELIISQQKENIEGLLFDIHQLESDVLGVNCNISNLTYNLEYLEMQRYSNGGKKIDSEISSVIDELGDHMERLERLGDGQTKCEERLLSLRRQVQSCVGSHISTSISSNASVFMLNIDTQLGMVMLAVSQIGRKRISALEQVCEVIQNRTLKMRQEEENEKDQNLHPKLKDEVASSSLEQGRAKSDDEYIKIIDKLTKEMFDYKIDKKPTQYSSSLPKVYQSSKMTRSESEYERVMKELDLKLEISRSKNKMEDISCDVGRPLSVASTPRSVTKKVHDLSLETFDKMFEPPDKIQIPERYQPDIETDDEDGYGRKEKSSDIRKMLVDMTGQTDYNLQKNQEIAKLAVTRSVILAGSASKQADYDYDEDDLEEESPVVSLPIVQQRDSFIL